MVITPIFTPEIVVSDELSETDRGTGGFGSTGKNKLKFWRQYVYI